MFIHDKPPATPALNVEEESAKLDLKAKTKGKASPKVKGVVNVVTAMLGMMVFAGSI